MLTNRLEFLQLWHQPDFLLLIQFQFKFHLQFQFCLDSTLAAEPIFFSMTDCFLGNYINLLVFNIPWRLLDERFSNSICNSSRYKLINIFVTCLNSSLGIVTMSSIICSWLTAPPTFLKVDSFSTFSMYPL